MLSSFNLVSIRHPGSFALWDYAFEVTSRLSFFTFDTVFNYSLPLVVDVANGTATRPTSSYELTLYMLLPTVEGGVFVHTPLGTTSFAAGLAAAFVSYTDSLDSSGRRLVPAYRLMASHTAFFNDRWYFVNTLEVVKFQAGNLPVATSSYQLTELISFFGGIGYYFPEGRTAVRRSM